MSILKLNKEDIFKGPLILVNRSLPLKSSKSLLIPLSNEGKILLERQASVLLSKLIDEIDAKDYIVPVSGYRSRDEQEELYESSMKENGREFTEKYVAYPDCSEHQTGLAVDLGRAAENIDFICPDFPDEGVCKKFKKRAAAYGFIERYQEEKEEITGIGFEPWHFRYIGYPHSEILNRKGMCLEEYIEYLKQFPASGTHLNFNKDGRNIEIFYVKHEMKVTYLNLPETALCQVSGNNIDGFIVTLWR